MPTTDSMYRQSGEYRQEGAYRACGVRDSRTRRCDALMSSSTKVKGEQESGVDATEDGRGSS